MMTTDIDINTGHPWDCKCPSCGNTVILRYAPKKNDNRHVWGTYVIPGKPLDKLTYIRDKMEEALVHGRAGDKEKCEELLEKLLKELKTMRKGKQ